MKIVIRCKTTQIYFKRTWQAGTPFITGDIRNATMFEDSPKIREDFTRNYPFELEFVPMDKI